MQRKDSLSKVLPNLHQKDGGTHANLCASQRSLPLLNRVQNNRYNMPSHGWLLGRNQRRLPETNKAANYRRLRHVWRPILLNSQRHCQPGQPHQLDHILKQRAGPKIHVGAGTLDSASAWDLLEQCQQKSREVQLQPTDWVVPRTRIIAPETQDLKCQSQWREHHQEPVLPDRGQTVPAQSRPLLDLPGSEALKLDHLMLRWEVRALPP